MVIEIEIFDWKFHTEDTTFVKFKNKLEEIFVLARLLDYEIKAWNTLRTKEFIMELSNDKHIFGLNLSYESYTTWTGRQNYISSISLTKYDVNTELLNNTPVYEGQRNDRVITLLDKLKDELSRS